MVTDDGARRSGDREEAGRLVFDRLRRAYTDSVTPHIFRKGVGGDAVSGRVPVAIVGEVERERTPLALEPLANIDDREVGLTQ